MWMRINTTVLEKRKDVKSTTTSGAGWNIKLGIASLTGKKMDQI